MSDSRRVWIAGAAGFFLVLLPFGTFVTTNYKDASFVSVNFIWFFLETAPLVIAVLLAVVGLLYFCTSRRAAHSLSRAILTASGVFFLLFSYHHPYLRLFPAHIADWIPASLYLVLVALFAVLLFKLAKHFSILLAVLFFAAANLALTLPLVARTTVEATRTVSFRNADLVGPSAAATGPRPNVYYFILDAYPSASSLRQNLGFGDAPFIRAMEERGFYHADSAISSYNRTIFTLASIFAQDYFVADEMTLEEGRRRKLTYPPLLNAPNPPRLVVDAKRLGYEFYLVGNYWAACTGPWVSCYAEAEGSAYLADVFWSATPSAALVATARTGDAGAAPDVDAIGKLRKRLEETGAPKTPTFTFVHHLSPHPPYIYRADCSLRAEYDLDLQSWSEEAKPYFLENLACTNIKVAQIVDEIIALDPNAIIVFQGDHGTAFSAGWDRPFDEWLPSWIHERSSILNLVRLPERCRSWLVPNLDNVNTIRAVMACISGRAPALDDIRGYVSTYSEESPDHGQIRRIDPTSFRALPAEVRG